jgi:toxin ParE1/3/4
VNQIVLRPSANRDLVAIFRHYLREAVLRVADRFFLATETTFARLAGMPGIGMQYESDESLYADLRYFPISRFRKYLIFYRPLPDGIEVLRILHGSRDIAAILAEGFAAKEDDDATETEAEPEQ